MNKEFEKIVKERDTYKLGFETVMKFIREYARDTNDGSLLLNLTFASSELDAENDVELEAFLLIEDAIDPEAAEEFKKRYCKPNLTLVK